MKTLYESLLKNTNGSLQDDLYENLPNVITELFGVPNHRAKMFNAYVYRFPDDRSDLVKEIKKHDTLTESIVRKIFKPMLDWLEKAGYNKISFKLNGKNIYDDSYISKGGTFRFPILIDAHDNYGKLADNIISIECRKYIHSSSYIFVIELRGDVFDKIKFLDIQK